MQEERDRRLLAEPVAGREGDDVDAVERVIGPVADEAQQRFGGLGSDRLPQRGEHGFDIAHAVELTPNPAALQPRGLCGR